ncbi:HAD family hydrolase [Gluconobacter kanchanaburiensis]|uniref:phosphoglycolate phosphatase n=1 Tax=Gluconobacter kanchanaburiensis NBRC 103587 TaxID=1307948 RepID=A0A511BBQ9_9PROT|nr:HAD family hydrolase [Gluconobacter kanchanaburiensis]MBF0861622.1 HAD family hydrolase [Gluconobacter kanchanaburiensis]GEK95267.1 haloacid dehalogenase [Gluconobacter kanchanaburiensis NBRC 103587]
MTRFPILLLDYDGTLAETQPAILRSLTEAFGASGIAAPSPEALRQELTRGGTLQTLFQAMVPESDEDDAAAFVRHYRTFYPKADAEETVLFDGVVESLNALKEKGKILAILSNKHAPTVCASLARFGLTSFFAGVIGSEPNFPHKPDPRVMAERVLPLFPQRSRSEFLMVGDTAADLQFARNAGIASCWASYGHGSAPQCEALQPDLRIDAFSGILNIPL